MLNSKAFVESLSTGAGAGKRACAEQQAFVEAYPQVRAQEGARAEQQSVRGKPVRRRGGGKVRALNSKRSWKACLRARTQESARALNSKAFVESLSAGAGVGRCVR